MKYLSFHSIKSFAVIKMDDISGIVSQDVEGIPTLYIFNFKHSNPLDFRFASNEKLNEVVAEFMDNLK